MAETMTLETVTTGYLIRRHRDGLLIPPGQDRAAMNRLFTWVVAAGSYDPRFWNYLDDDGTVYQSTAAPVEMTPVGVVAEATRGSGLNTTG